LAVLRDLLEHRDAHGTNEEIEDKVLARARQLRVQAATN
jgi:hypothetical protein